MNTQIRFALMSLFVLSAPAFAQDEEETNVDVQVGMPGMPANMNMNMNVKTTTTRKTTTTTTTTEPAPAPAPVAARSDCGAGEDSGCSMRRNGQLPMDYESFRGFFDSLKSQSNEISRSEIAATTLKNDYLTAKQLGLILELFNNEITRFDVAKAAAPHVVNPKHAMGLSSKFRNGITASDFSKLMASQR